MLVVLFHLHSAVSRTATDWLWSPLDWIARNGFYGVDIFFVISGFVIALSVSKGQPTFSYLGRFILRRSIRLDPPYWSAILLEIVLISATLRFFSGYTTPLPTAPQVLAHLAYAQEFLGYKHVIDIFWTLCYEIQFYGFFVGLIVLKPMLPGVLRRPFWIALFCAAIFALSLWTRYWPPEGLVAGLAINRWFQFFVGVLTWRAVTAPGRMAPLITAWAAIAAAVVAAGAPVLELLAVAVSALLVGAARDTRWGWVFTLRPFTFLGAMSYSLYLYHAPVGWRFVSLVQRVIPGPWSPATALLVYGLGIVVAVVTAGVLWRLIERPCLKLSQRIRLPLRTESLPPAPGAAPAVAAALP